MTICAGNMEKLAIETEWGDNVTKIYCVDSSCAYNNDKGVCTAKKVTLSWHSVMTVHDGRQEYNRCKTREPGKRYLDIEKVAKEMMQKLTGKDESHNG